MKSLNRLGKLLVLAALVVYLWAPGFVSPSVRAEDTCFPGVVCEGDGSQGNPCDCPVSNCTGCFVKNGTPGCGNCAGDAEIQ